MDFNFWKMQGAGNDFILVDDRQELFPCSETEWIAGICTRRTGIGCEGLILIRNSSEADFRMRFFNPDGTEVEMCANGARCVARLAHEIGAAPSPMAIETIAGVLRAEIRDGDSVSLGLTAPKDWRLNRTFEIEGDQLTYHFVNSGVPHAVIEVDDLAGLDVCRIGRAIRRHDDFAPAGTNANFICRTGPDSIMIRTYERGVETETLACGTGIAASALVAARLNLVEPPVKVKAAGGDILTVDFRMTDETAEEVTLLGPARHVFTGTIQQGRD